MNIESQIAELEREARGLAQRFIANADAPEPAKTQARAAIKIIELAELASTLVPVVDFERMMATRKVLAAEAEQRIYTAILNNEDADAAVQREIAYIDSTGVRDAAALKDKYAAAAWQRAFNSLSSMQRGSVVPN